MFREPARWGTKGEVRPTAATLMWTACEPKAGFRPSPQRHTVSSPWVPPTALRKVLQPACLQVRSLAVLPCGELGVPWVRWETR